MKLAEVFQFDFVGSSSSQPELRSAQRETHMTFGQPMKWANRRYRVGSDPWSAGLI